MKKILNQKNSFTVDSIKVVFGTVLSQSINVLSIPLLSRIYSPESIGENAIFLSILAVLSMIACGRYECAVMLPEQQQESITVLHCSLIFCSVFTLLCFLMCRGLLFLNLYTVDSYLYWSIPLGVFLTGTSNAISFWLLRDREFWLISITKITSSFFTVATQFLLGVTGSNSAKSLLLGVLLGYLTLMISYSLIIICKYLRVFLDTFSWKEIINTFYRYRNFPLIDFWSALLDNAAGQIPVFILKQFFPVAQVGHYSMAMRVISIPVGLISTSISQVFFQRASEMYRQGANVHEFAQKIYKKIFLIGIIPLSIVAVAGQSLLTFILGSQWVVAGQISQIMAPALFFALLFNPLSSIVVICERQRDSLLVRILMIIVAIFPLLVTSYIHPCNILLSIFSLSISQCLLYLCLSRWNLNIAKLA